LHIDCSVIYENLATAEFMYRVRRHDWMIEL